MVKRIVEYIRRKRDDLVLPVLVVLFVTTMFLTSPFWVFFIFGVASGLVSLMVRKYQRLESIVHYFVTVSIFIIGFVLASFLIVHPPLLPLILEAAGLIAGLLLVFGLTDWPQNNSLIRLD